MRDVLEYFILFAVVLLVCQVQCKWIPGKHYEYKITSRTVTSLLEVENIYTGVFLKGVLIIQPQNETHLRAQILNSQYADIPKDHYDSSIASKLNFKNYPVTQKSFTIIVESGIVRDLIVEKSTPTWQLNYMKSMLGPLQLDLKVINAITSDRKQFLRGDSSNANFKSTEASVSGKCEVSYTVSPFSQTLMVSYPHYFTTKETLHRNLSLPYEKSIHITKRRNFTNCERKIGFHFGFNGENGFDSEDPEKVAFLKRSAETQTIVSDYKNDGIIEASETIDLIVMKPDLFEQEHGVVKSKIGMNLIKFEDVITPLPPVINPQSTGNLLYTFHSPFESPEARKIVSSGRDSKTELDESDFIENKDGGPAWMGKTNLEEATNIPLLPFFIGNEGNVVWKTKETDLYNTVRTMALNIASDIENNDFVMNNTSEKMTVIIRLIRTMNASQVNEVAKSLTNGKYFDNVNFENKNEKLLWNAWTVFQNAVPQTGTGPALVSVKKWIEQNMITDAEAIQAITALSKTVTPPTLEYLENFFELITMLTVTNNDSLHHTAVLSFADLIKHSLVQDNNGHNTFPMHNYGLFEKNKIIEEKYLPFLAEKLKNAVEKEDSIKIQTYILAIGKTAHRKILSFFKPYLEGKIPISKYQRTWMVLSLHKFTKVWPTIARSVLYKIYMNTLDDYEIRSTAVFLIMLTNPPLDMLERMANFTNYDPSVQVSSVVISSLVSASLHKGDYELKQNAKKALLLTNTKFYNTLYSNNLSMMFMSTNSNLIKKINLFYVTDHDNLIKDIFADIQFTVEGIKLPPFQFGGMVSCINNLIRTISQQFSENESPSDFGDKNIKWSTENIAKMLGIEAGKSEQIEGALFYEFILGNAFMPFDNRTLEDVKKQLNKLMMSWQKKHGNHEESFSYGAHETTLSFPTESGFPFVYTMETSYLRKNIISTILKSDYKIKENGAFPPSGELSSTFNLINSHCVQGRMGFVAPFKSKHYLTGYDKNIQIQLPIKINFEYNTDRNEYTLKAEPVTQDTTYTLMKQENVPFIADMDLLNIEPVKGSSHIHIIKPKNLTKIHFDFIPGIVWESHFVASSEKSYFSDILQSLSLFTAIRDDFYHVRFNNHSLTWNTRTNVFKEAKLTISFDYFVSNAKFGNSSSDKIPAPHARKINIKNNHSAERKFKLLNESLNNLTYGEGLVIDLVAQLKSWYTVNIIHTLAAAYSSADRKIIVNAYLQAQYDEAMEDTVEICLNIESILPMMQILDPKILIASDLLINTEYDLHFGIKDCHSSKLRIREIIKRSGKSKSDLMKHEEVVKCLSANNNLLINCESALELAKVPDEIGITFFFDNSAPLLKDILLRINSELITLISLNSDLKVNIKPTTNNNDSLNIQVLFGEPEGTVKISISSPDMDVIIDNAHLMNISNYGQKVNTLSMYSEVNRRVSLDLLDLKVCLVDDSMIKTIDDKIYNVVFGRHWHALLTTYPKENPNNPNEKFAIAKEMRTSILIRDTNEERRELRIVFGSNNILFHPLKNNIQIIVNAQRIMFNDTDFYQMYNSFKNLSIFEIYKLSDNLYVLKSSIYSIGIVYDGNHINIMVDDVYFNSVRGLCGNFDGNIKNEFETPKRCKEENDQIFAASWILENEENEGPVLTNRNTSTKNNCIYDKPNFQEVITTEEAGEIKIR